MRIERILTDGTGQEFLVHVDIDEGGKEMDAAIFSTTRSCSSLLRFDESTERLTWSTRDFFTSAPHHSSGQRKKRFAGSLRSTRAGGTSRPTWRSRR